MLERKKILSLIITLIFITGITLGNISPAAAMVGEVQFDRDYYSLGQAGIIVYEASGLDSVTVTVTSSSDTAGIQVDLAESQQGIYRGSLTLTTGDSDDTQDRLKVSNGDTIKVTYNNGTTTITDTATIDTTPPQASSFTPAGGAKGISTEQISVVFSEPINFGDNSGGISITDSNGNHINIQQMSIVNGNTLALDLYSGSLRYQGTYTVTLPAGSMVDLAGNGCSEVSWSFSTVDMKLDRSVYKSYDAVSVILYDSAKGSGSVTVKAECDSYGSGPIYVTLSGSGGVFEGSFTLSGPAGNSDDSNDILGVTAYYDGFTVSYDPDNDGTYEVFASANVDNQAPIVSATSPQDGAADVAVDESITITFSEPVQPGGQFNLIKIKDNAGNPVGGISCIIEGSTLTINHDAFEHSTQYTLYLPTDAVRDAVGNMYNTSNFELLNFTTAAIPPAEIHVDDTGSDTAGDGSESNPYSTITKALQVANDGDTIIVHDGTYQESVVVTKDVTITSLNGPEVTSIQPAAGDGFAIQPVSGSYRARRITGFTISGASHGISVSGMSGGEVYLENNIISGCGDGIYIEDHSGGTVYVQKNTITGNTDAGIRLGTSADGDWVEVKWNNIVNNGSGIVHNGTNQLDAPLNFWGNPHGPTHDGIYYGDTISGNIDFQPWLVGEFTGGEITTELDIDAPALGDGYVELEYLEELPEQPNVGSTLQWSLYSGSLPEGINIVSGRVLYGTPVASGIYSFALEASNGTQAVYKDVSLNVAATYGGSGPAVVTRTPAPYETGIAVDEPIIIVFNEPVQLIDGYQGYITITNEEDPYDNVAADISLQTTKVSNDTLVINHENLRPDTLYKVTIASNAVADVDGNDFETVWYFTTGSETIPLEITTSALPQAAVDESYSAQLEASGGSGSYRWSIASGSLPAGLGLSSNTGIISGTPAQGGTFNFTVQVTDELGNTAEKALSITVEVPDTIPPEVIYKIPDHNETGVPQNITITVKFNEPIQQGNSFNSISIGGGISFTQTIEGDVLKLDPSGDLAENTWYTVEIPAGAVMDMAGNETTSIISFSFQTGETQDTYVPQVSITTPADDGGIFSNRLTVTGFIYEESLRLVEVSLFSVGQNTYWNGSAGSWVADEIWNSVSFSEWAPDYDFQYVMPVLLDGEYQLSVRALDYAGNTSEVETVAFEMDSTQPEVVSVVPSSGATDVAVDQPITVTFNEDVIPGDLNALTFEDANTGTDIAFQASLNEQTDTLIITHLDLEYDTVYELFIDEGIVKDLAGNNNVEKFITFKTIEGDGTTGGIPSKPPATVQVIFEDGDADGVYYYRSGGESDTLSFSLSGLPAGYSLEAEFGALDAGGNFTVTGAVYNEPVGGIEIESGVYLFSVDIANSNNNNYLPVAVRLSGLPAGVDIQPFVLTGTSAGPDEVRLAFVNLYPPQPEQSGLTLVVEPLLDSFDNLRAVPGVKFSLKEEDGTKIGSIEVGSETNPLDFLATDENGEPQLAKLQQAMKISADYDYNQLAAGIDTDVLSFLADKDATITFYNVSEVLGVQLTQDNFRQMISLEVLDNDGNAVSNIAEYVNVSSMNYVPADGETSDMLIIPVNHFTTYKITPAEDYGKEAPVHYDDEDDDKDRETDRYTTEKAAEEAEKVEDIANNPDAAENEIGEAAVNVSYSLLKAAEKVKSEEDARKLAEAASRTAKSLRKAAERIQEEETAVKVVDSTEKLMSAVTAMIKSVSDFDKDTIVGSVLDAVETAKLASEKVVTSEKAGKTLAAHSEIIKNLSTVADAAEDEKAVEAIVEKTAELLDRSSTLVEKLEAGETAVNTVKEMIEGVGGLYKALDDNIEKGSSRAKTLLADKIINAAERAIQKAATSELQKDGLNIEQEKATAKADAAGLQTAAKTAVENAREIAEKLKKNEIEPNRSIKPVVLIDVPTVEGIREVEVDLPAEAVDAVREAGVDALEIRTEFADFKVNPESLDKDGINGETGIISFRARKIDRMQIPETLRNSIPENSIVVDLDAAAGGQKIRQFNKPVEAAIPYKLGNKKLKEEVTVFLIEENGTVTPVGGKYDEVTGKVRFRTMHFSSYFAKPSVREFSDLGKYPWAKKEIELLAGKGIIKGRTETAFDPAAPVTRAEFAALLTRLLNLEGSSSSHPFTDVESQKWYADEVAAAYNSGVITGRSADKFDPDGLITRQEMAAMIARVLFREGYRPADEAELAVFVDADDIAAWAQNAVSTALREGIIQGMGDNTFKPKAKATRAQAAVMLYRLFNK